MTRSRFLHAGVGVLATGVFAACGGPAADGGVKQGGSVAPASPSKKEVTLIVDNDWTGGDRVKIVQGWLERANKVYPHIKTELRDNAASQDKTIALFASGEEGDLYQLDQHVVPVFGPKNVLQDITSTLAALKFDVNSVYDVNNITHWNGKRHGLLIQLNSFNFIYNIDAFQQAGIKAPAASWTWNDWLDMAKKLNRPLDATPQWGTTISGEPYHMFWTAGAPYLDAKGTMSLWDTPACRAVVQWMVDLAQRHRVMPTQREANEKKLNFNNGNYAINPYAVPTPAITKNIDGKFQWDVLPPPKHPQSGKAVNTVTGHNYLVTAKAKQRGVLTEAVQVLVELYDKEVQELYISGLNVGSLPILKSTAAKAGNMQGMPKNFKIALDVIGTSQNFEKIIGFLDLHRAWRPEFWKALDGEVTVEQAVANMARVSNAALAQAAR
ncbi:MAG: extracellular solute-binding protein [Chloroflexi bacterium]|nr:extracellular solute-binding protein [Chloroflexota bacterium]